MEDQEKKNVEDFNKRIDHYAEEFEKVVNSKKGLSRPDLAAIAYAACDVMTDSIAALVVMIDFPTMEEKERHLKSWLELFEQKLDNRIQTIHQWGVRVKGLDPSEIPRIVEEFTAYMEKKLARKKEEDGPH